MDALGGLWSGVSSLLLSKPNTSGQRDGADDDDLVDVAACGDDLSIAGAPTDASQGDLHEDWMMVVEDRKSVARAVPISDVHAQRVSCDQQSRPKEAHMKLLLMFASPLSATFLQRRPATSLSPPITRTTLGALDRKPMASTVYHF
jgi:hypothetical protein